MSEIIRSSDESTSITFFCFNTLFVQDKLISMLWNIHQSTCLEKTSSYSTVITRKFTSMPYQVWDSLPYFLRWKLEDTEKVVRDTWSYEFALDEFFITFRDGDEKFTGVSFGDDSSVFTWTQPTFYEVCEYFGLEGTNGLIAMLLLKLLVLTCSNVLARSNGWSNGYYIFNISGMIILCTFVSAGRNKIFKFD